MGASLEGSDDLEAIALCASRLELVWLVLCRVTITRESRELGG